MLRVHRVLFSRFSFAVVLFAAAPAAAWSDGPLCAARAEPDAQALCRSVSSRPALTEATELCWPDGLTLEGASGDSERPDHIADARKNLSYARALAQAGKLEDAVLHLRNAEQQPLSITDRIALERGELLRALNMPEQACEAFALAQNSPEREVAVRAQIGSVFCAFESGDKKGEALLKALISRYPNLTQRDELNFAFAVAREGWGNRPGAMALLRQIDLERPASQTAGRARVELARLAQLGVHPEPYTWRERVQRAERMLRSGPIDVAAAEVDALQPDALTNPSLRAQVVLLSARIARIQGRFDQADQATRTAQPIEATLKATSAEFPSAPAQAPEISPERLAAERKIQSIRANRPTDRLSSGQVRQLFELAAEVRDKALCTEMLDAARIRRGFAPPVRYDMALRATGLADDVAVLAMLETLLDAPEYRVAARYHHARALERLGRLADAEREYHGVIALERADVRYYTMWANVRLAALREQVGGRCAPAGDEAPVAAQLEASLSASQGDLQAIAASEVPAMLEEIAATESDSEPETVGGEAEVALVTRAPGLFGDRDQTFDEVATPTSAWEVLREIAQEPETSAPVASDELLAGDPEKLRVRSLKLLRPLAEQHGEAYPWLGRACELIELERFSDASDEISEAYMAWRDASGASRMRSGLVSLLTGNVPAHKALTPALRRARIALDLDARTALGQVAMWLGDPGIAFRVGSASEREPQVYAQIVEAAAAKHGLDPNLLFAVMRVESVFNRRILSNAGAVGLMQIMPHTGQRIAFRLGIDDFDPMQLLSPERNLEFSAWYLASLLRRFDGRLPLAIASYNGGPHNVRLWMRNNPADMPLDAFLERIPFKETHRYVRRVLSFYALYRAQKALPVAPLSVELPRLTPDEVAF
jgi:soluble lytic murein transglycosylase-like protein